MPAPQYCPTPRELDDLELLLAGAYSPRTNFDEVIRLDPPTDLVDTAADDSDGGLELVDPEGLPLARWTPASLEPLNTPSYGPFRRLHLTPAQAHAAYPGAVVVPVAGPLTTADLDHITGSAGDRPVILLALSGHGTPQGLSPVGLIRATIAAAGLLADAHVIAVPLPDHADPDLDHALGVQVAATYGTEVIAVTGAGDLPDPVATVVAADQPDEPGVVVFFTGLSGSGKSTLAQALTDLILEGGARTVTSLDGDVVRRHLSAGLTFSKQDRETNIRRIGWVAAEIARHRGIAICSPIAPFDLTRKQVRAMVEDAGGRFVLVHVATPLEECERRDRKGLYAKARAGEIPEFTGISSPYEVPQDADLAVDTTGRSVADVLADVLKALPFEVATVDEPGADA